MSATSNTLTLLHSNAQPNVALLRFFNYDLSNALASHPLYTRLKTLSWLQLLHPSSDTSTIEPTPLSSDTLANMKSSKRGIYHRKRRRWERVQKVIAETQAGGFDGLVVASAMEPVSILKHLVPLLRGGAQIVIYSPYIEPLVELADLYSTRRRVAYKAASGAERLNEEDFPLDPTLILAPMIQTSKLRQWQCLPGRTHPLMTARGGAEGYLFTATRVLPAEGRVEARGNFKRRKQTAVGTSPLANEGPVTDEKEVAPQIDIPIVNS
jgi:tRNA (adenine-N(1)-)-methyltransferase non-catalytic subunit